MDKLKVFLEKLKQKRFLLPFTITVGVLLVAINSYLLLNPSSNVERAYYLNQYEIVSPGNYVQFLPKDAILASKETLYITEDATLLNDIRVKPGQPIQNGDELALFSEGKQGDFTRQLEIEEEAYEDELENLKYVLDEIEYMGDRFDPTSSIETEQLDEFISVTLEAEIMQEQSTSGAIAIIQQAIAATERQLQIIEARLQDAAISKAITSPITGSIGEIKQQDGKVTFEIHSEEQNLVAYVNEEEWKKVQTEQDVKIFVEDTNEPFSGVVVEKQALPATETLWYKLMKEKSLVQHEAIVYEIRIDINDLIEAEPFATAVNSDIIISTYPESSLVPSTWAQYEDPLNEVDAQLYTLGYDGKIRLSPITVLDKVDVGFIQPMFNEPLPVEDFINNDENEDLDENADIEAGFDEEQSAVENIEEVETVVSTQKEDQLETIKKRLDSNENQDVIVFNRLESEYTTILSERTRNVNAPAFLPLPMERFSITEIGTIRWQDVLKYLFY